MSTFLIRSATSQSSSYIIVLTRLDGPRSRPYPHLKFVEVPGIESATSWSVVRHADHYTNEAVYIYIYWLLRPCTYEKLLLQYYVNNRYSDVSCMSMRSSESLDLEHFFGNTNRTFSQGSNCCSRHEWVKQVSSAWKLDHISMSI